jgi:hypothetical protein
VVVANKLIIDPEALKAIRAAVAALEAKQEPAPELDEPGAVGPMPERVRRFWHHEERVLQPWNWNRARGRNNATPREWWERAEKDDWNASAHLANSYEEGWGGLEKSEDQAGETLPGSSRAR